MYLLNSCVCVYVWRNARNVFPGSTPIEEGPREKEGGIIFCDQMPNLIPHKSENTTRGIFFFMNGSAKAATMRKAELVLIG